MIAPRRSPFHRLCVALAAALVAFWIATAWFGVTWHPLGSKWGIGFAAGTLDLYRGYHPTTNKDFAGLRCSRQPSPAWRLWFRDDVELAGCFVTGHIYRIPVWTPAAAALTPPVVGLVLARRRRRAHHCTACGYDRRGIECDTTCPECGNSPVPFHEASRS